MTSKGGCGCQSMKGGYGEDKHVHFSSDKIIPLNDYSSGDPSYPPVMQSSRLLGGARKQRVKGGASILGSDVVSSFGSVDSVTTNVKLMTGSSIVNPAVHSQNVSRPALV